MHMFCYVFDCCARLLVGWAILHVLGVEFMK